MHIELVEILRCPRAHDDAWMVARMDELRDREIVHGTLGCPVCFAEYPVVDGVARLRPDDPPSVPSMHVEDAMRAAALLGLSEPGSYAVMAGAWGTLAPTVSAMTDVRVVALNTIGVVGGAGAWGLWAPDGTLPLAAGSARGIALDARHTALASLAVAALRAGGRLVAPVATPLPAGVKELARDGTWWVAEREATPRLVELGRA